MSRFPNVGFVASAPALVDRNINNAAPENPIKIPTIRVANNFSFKNIALKTRTIIGVLTINTEALIGDVRESPHINVTILKPTPQKAASAIDGNSLKGTFSLGPAKIDITQKIAQVITTLYQVNPKGPIYFGVTSFAAVKL